MRLPGLSEAFWVRAIEGVKNKYENSLDIVALLLRSGHGHRHFQASRINLKKP